MSLTKNKWTIAELTDKLHEYEALLISKGMARNTVHTYVQHPERFIRYLQGQYDPTGPRHNTIQNKPESHQVNTRSKYAPLTMHLANVTESPIEFSFSEIEKILGFELPDSAYLYQAWWANEKTGTHSHARSWINASFKTSKVDLNSKTVTFFKEKGFG